MYVQKIQFACQVHMYVCTANNVNEHRNLCRPFFEKEAETACLCNVRVHIHLYTYTYIRDIYVCMCVIIFRYLHTCIYIQGKNVSKL